MMTIDDIKALIASDESRTLELKKTTGELKDGMKIKDSHESFPYNWNMAHALYRSTTDQARPKFAPSSPQVRQIVEFMGEGNYTIKELTELCGFTDPKHFREGYIKPALRENALERLYPDRPNHPKQKYRLTEAAREWKNNNS